MTITLLQGDALSVLATLDAGSIQTIITSPPYFGLRKYSSDPREIGQEAAPDCLAWARREPPCGACFVCALRAVFAAVWRVLRDDGTCWINLGDSYARTGGTDRKPPTGTVGNTRRTIEQNANRDQTAPEGMKEKNLLLIPARVALALQSDGWIVRSDVIWSKPNCMPESVRDRPTRAHEYVYLLSKQARYYYDADAIREPNVSSEEKFDREAARYKENGKHLATQHSPKAGNRTAGDDSRFSGGQNPAGRNKRSVFSVPVQYAKLRDDLPPDVKLRVVSQLVERGLL